MSVHQLVFEHYVGVFHGECGSVALVCEQTAPGFGEQVASYSTMRHGPDFLRLAEAHRDRLNAKQERLLRGSK